MAAKAKRKSKRKEREYTPVRDTKQEYIHIPVKVLGEIVSAVTAGDFLYDGVTVCAGGVVFGHDRRRMAVAKCATGSIPETGVMVKLLGGMREMVQKHRKSSVLIVSIPVHDLSPETQTWNVPVVLHDYRSPPDVGGEAAALCRLHACTEHSPDWRKVVPEMKNFVRRSFNPPDVLGADWGSPEHTDLYLFPESDLFMACYTVGTTPVMMLAKGLHDDKSSSDPGIAKNSKCRELFALAGREF